MSADEDPRKARVRAHMESDFVPMSDNGGARTPEARIANALEYIAFQLGQINRKMGKGQASAATSYQDKLQVDLDALDRI